MYLYSDGWIVRHRFRRAIWNDISAQHFFNYISTRATIQPMKVKHELTFNEQIKLVHFLHVACLQPVEPLHDEFGIFMIITATID